MPILAAPLVIPFAKAVPALAGIIGGIGMAALSNKVNEYIQDNPEESMKILSTIIPGVGIGEIFMKKGKDEEVEEEVSVEDIDPKDLTKEEKAKMMKELAKSGASREKMIKGYEEIIQPGEDRTLVDAEERYDEGGVEDAPKPKFDYKKFFRNRRADGGAIGIEVLFEPKVPAAPSQLVEESEIVLGYRGDAGYRSGSAQASSIGQGNVGSKASFGGGKGTDRSGRSEGISGVDRSKVTQEQNINQLKNQLGIKDPNLIQKTFNKYNSLPFGVKSAINTMAPVELMKLFNIGNVINTGINQLKNPVLTDEDLTLGATQEISFEGNSPFMRNQINERIIAAENEYLKQGKMPPEFLGDKIRMNMELGNYKGYMGPGFEDGGRVGFFMGGPALEGQALNIYNSMNSYGFSDQEIANTLQGQGLYTPGSSTPDTPSDNIIGSQINQGAGGGGGITELQKTYTRETPRPYTVRNFPETSVQKDFFETKQLPSYTYNEMGGLKITPDVREDMTEYFADETSVGNYPVPEKDTSFIGSVKDKFGSIKDKFFQPKVKGTLGDRAQKQFELGQKLPSVFSAIAGMQSPFNPESRNYNPLMAGQLNFLEASPMVTRKSGQFIDPKLGAVEGNFMDVTGALIGRDPNTGALKYGPGSVLSGKNVISGFGTNDYETALMNYITKMTANKRISEAGKAAKLAAAQAELEAERERQRQAGQRTTNQGTLDYGITQGVSQRDYLSREKTRQRSDRQDEGKGPGGSTFDYSDPYDPGGGEKDGGFIDGYNRRKYSDGGLATMFVEKR